MAFFTTLQVGKNVDEYKQSGGEWVKMMFDRRFDV